MKRARKVSLISVYDYPKNWYTAHWYIYVDGDEAKGYDWRVEIVSYEPTVWLHDGVVTGDRPDVPWPQYPADLPRMATAEQHDARRRLIEHLYDKAPKPQYVADYTLGGHTASRDEADTAAQKWVLDRIGKYRRAEPLEPHTDERVTDLVAEFDLARAAHDFARVDRIRGALKASGIVLTEGETIGYPAPTQWSRKGE